MRVDPAQLPLTLRFTAFVASRTAFLLCVCCGLPHVSSGAEPPQASFVVPRTVANNPSIARAAALVGAARGNWIQVGLRPNPSVGYEGQQLGSGGLAEQQGVTVSQEFVRGGKLRWNRSVAANEVRKAEQQLAAQTQRVLTDTRSAFAEALLAQRQIDLSLELARIADQGLKTATDIARSLEGSRVDVLQAELEAENAGIIVQDARNRHHAAWQSLAAVVGQPTMPPQALAGDVYAAPRAFDQREVLTLLLSTSPEIATAATEVDRARAAVGRARVERQPNVAVQGLMNWQDNGIGGKPDGAVGVSVPIPLFDRNQGGVMRAQYELAASERAFSQLELDLQERLAPVYERYANARYRVDRYRSNILPRAAESLDLTGKLYAAGEINFVSILTVQRTFTQTNFSYLTALRELRVAEAQLDGFLLSGSLR